MTAGSAQTRLAGGIDAFVTKLDASGKLVYSTFLGGAGDDYGFSIAVDPAGNAVVTGDTNSTNFPLTLAAHIAALIRPLTRPVFRDYLLIGPM